MKKYIIIIIAAFSMVSCRDFLDITPKGETIPATVKDYDELLNGGDEYMNNTLYEQIFQYSTDNFRPNMFSFEDVTNPLNTRFHLYTWSNKRFADPNTPENSWNSAYKNIYTLNKIINEVENSEMAVSYVEEDKQRIKAEARHQRALEYLLLVNIFAKHYKKSTSASDPGVPLVTVADVEQKTPDRGSVKGVYDFILKELNETLMLLPKNSVSPTRPNKGSGYALLARTYLYMGNYAKAKENAALALAEKSNLGDLTASENLNQIKDAENYSFHYMDTYIVFRYGYLSDDLVNSFEPGDQRLQGFYDETEGPGNGYTPNLMNEVKGNLANSVGEMMVTLAECEARLGNPAAAITILNTIRNKRIIGNTPLSGMDFQNNDDLLKFIFKERRKEVLTMGIHLFDLKRLNLESKFAKIITHKVNDDVFTAEPNSNKLVLPIPGNIMKFNTNWPQN